VIKLIFCLRRLSGLSLEEFQNYWYNTHGPLVRSHAETLKIRRYLQSHTLDNASLQGALASGRGAPQAYDGVAELWWNNLEDLAAGTATPEGRDASRALLEDERKFIDHAASPLFIVEERRVVDST
jgi:uncharacterized protein (TIGR02118 family)